MMNLYTVKGEIINSFEEFVKYYENIYYFNNSYIAENIIDNILKNGIQTKKDVYNVLAWKLDGINMNKTNSSGDIHYKGENWIFSKSLIQGNYRGGKIDLTDYLEFLTDDKLLEIKNAAADNGAKTLDLLNTTTKGIGSVCLITLLYFFNQGKKYPIYDKYAHIALKVILSDIPILIGSVIIDKEISKPFSDKKTKDFGKVIMQGKYKEFMKCIDKIKENTGVDYYTSRSIDRALWAYGHLFREPNIE